MCLFGEGRTFGGEGQNVPEVLYRVEGSRGYAAVGDLWSPGCFVADLALGHDVTLVASAEPWGWTRRWTTGS